eukprot:c1465_g1_i1 orf=1-210(-)
MYDHTCIMRWSLCLWWSSKVHRTYKHMTCRSMGIGPPAAAVVFGHQAIGMTGWMCAACTYQNDGSQLICA